MQRGSDERDEVNHNTIMAKLMPIVPLLFLCMVSLDIVVGLKGWWEKCSSYDECEPHMSCVSSYTDIELIVPAVNVCHRLTS